jgi:formate dehydrogenase assembly factor FdhD
MNDIFTKGRSPDDIAEIAVGLIASAAFMARRDIGSVAEVELLDAVSSWTTKMRIEARQKQARENDIIKKACETIAEDQKKACECSRREHNLGDSPDPVMHFL